MQFLIRLFRSLRTHGPRHTWRSGDRHLSAALAKLSDRSFDSGLGTDTASFIEIPEMTDVRSGHLYRGIRYEPTRAAGFRRLLTDLRAPRTGTFVDIGAGKGRVLMLAVECGFARVAGVDFSPRVCEIARCNLEVFRRRWREPFECSVFEVDATTFAFQPDHNVIYLFNPFDDFVLRKVLRNLVESLARSPRDVWIIYNNPVHRCILDDNGIFQEVMTRTLGGSDYVVFRNQRDPDSAESVTDTS